MNKVKNENENEKLPNGIIQLKEFELFKKDVENDTTIDYNNIKINQNINDINISHQFEVTKKELITYNKMSYQLATMPFFATLKEKRILQLIINQITLQYANKNETIDFTKHIYKDIVFTFNLNDLASTIPLNYKEVIDFEDSLINIRSRDLVYKDTNTMVSITPFIAHRFDKKTMQVDLVLGRMAVPIFFNLTQYNEFQLETILRFKCKYAQTLFALLCGYVNNKTKNNKMSTAKFTVEQLRFIFGINEYKKNNGNIVKAKFTLYSNFKNRVLQSAVSEINNILKLQEYDKLCYLEEWDFIKDGEFSRNQSINTIVFTFNFPPINYRNETFKKDNTEKINELYVNILNNFKNNTEKVTLIKFWNEGNFWMNEKFCLNDKIQLLLNEQKAEKIFLNYNYYFFIVSELERIHLEKRKDFATKIDKPIGYFVQILKGLFTEYFT